jgi:hypothetical protein
MQTIHGVPGNSAPVLATPWGRAALLLALIPLCGCFPRTNAQHFPTLEAARRAVTSSCPIVYLMNGKTQQDSVAVYAVPADSVVDVELVYATGVNRCAVIQVHTKR